MFPRTHHELSSPRGQLATLAAVLAVLLGASHANALRSAYVERFRDG